MMKRYALILMTIVTLALTGCKDDKSFQIVLKVKDLGNRSVTMTYYGDNRVATMEARDKKGDGSLTFEGSSAQPTLVEFTLTSTGEPLLQTVARNGETLKCEIDLADPLAATVKGCGESELMSEFIKSNRNLIKKGDTRAVNEKIKEFIKANPTRVASTALLVSRFDLEGNERLADSLLNLIDPSARSLNMLENFNAVMSNRSEEVKGMRVRAFTFKGAADSLYTYSPSAQVKTLLVFTGRNNQGRDSITREMRRLTKDYKRDSIRVVELSLMPDSGAWRRSLAADSANWDRAWVPGGTNTTELRQLQINVTPFFIVADRDGRQLYRGRSIGAAVKIIEKK